MKIDIRQGEVPAALADLDDASCHACLTDPAYSLGSLSPEKFAKVLGFWLAGEEVPPELWGSGFLSRKWDTMPGPRHWREVFRVLKPGGHVLAFSSSRTSDLLSIALRLAGFEILPAFAWIYGEAMTLGADVSKAIDRAAGATREVTGYRTGGNVRMNSGGYGECSGGHRATIAESLPATDLARHFDGYRTRTRSMWEPVICARKPHDGPCYANAERHHLAGFNLDACRLPVEPEDAAAVAAKWTADTRGDEESYGGGWSGDRNPPDVSRGRVPGNVLLSCECRGEHEAGCPVSVIGEQSGERVSGGQTLRTAADKYSGGYGPQDKTGFHPGDTGTAARYYFQARASQSERHRGAEDFYWRRSPEHLDGWVRVSREEWEAIGERDYQEFIEGAHLSGSRSARGGFRVPTGPGQGHREDTREERAAEAARERNRAQGSPHPAMKPLRLIQYLSRLILPPTIDEPPRLLIPYSGSGSEICGALLGGWRDIVAREMSGQWCDVSRARVEWWQPWIEAGADDVAAILGEDVDVPERREMVAIQGSLFP